MPRRQRQRPPPEAAVSASGFFTLPLEIRQMIYKLLLVQDGGLAIAHDVFKRIKTRRDSEQPSTCRQCGIFFSSSTNLALHEERAAHHHQVWLHYAAYPNSRNLPNLPTISNLFLYTCRLIHHEATPILYQHNYFCFSDHETADSFRWSTNLEYSGLVREIGVSCGGAHRVRQSLNAWKNIGQNYSQLRRITIRLGTTADHWDVRGVYSQLKEAARNLRGLDSVHLQSFKFLKFLECLHPMVEKQCDSEMGLMQVRKHVTVADEVTMVIRSSEQLVYLTPDDGMVNWDMGISKISIKNATLWWGHIGDKVPNSTSLLC